MLVTSLTGSRFFLTLPAMLRGRSALFGSIVASALLITAPPNARAQMTGEQAVSAASASKSNLPPDTFGGEILFGQAGCDVPHPEQAAMMGMPQKCEKDFFLMLALRLNFNQDYWGVGFQVPVRLRVIDNEPKSDNDLAGLIRKQDWDEPSDFLRILRYVYIGQADKKGPFYIRIGELNGLTIGHGTIMNRYYNAIDPDVWHTGVNAVVNVGPFGGEMMFGDAINPYIVGGRLTARPLELALGEGLLWEKLVLGTTLLFDTKAPFVLASDGMGGIQLDEKNHPKVAESRTLGIFGVDVGLEVLSTELLSITPYIDLNKMSQVDNGWGLHMGVLWGLHFPMAVDTFVIDLRTEYRRVSGDYIGPYFNTTYEIERYQTLSSGGGLPVTKLGAVATSSASGRNGVLFDVLAGLPSYIFIGGEYIDYDGGFNDGSLRLSLEVPALQVIKFSAFYYRINMSGIDDFFKLDDRSAIVAQAQIPMYSVFTLNLRWWRVWQADPENQGEFRSTDDWSVGIGFALNI